MSLHYDFALACDLKPSVGVPVLAALTYIARPDADDPVPCPDLPDCDTFTWRDLFRAEDTGMPGALHRVFREAYRYTRSGRDVYRHTLDVRTFVKDDALGEYLAFADWLAPYSASAGCVGYFREEAAPHPVLIYFEDGAVDYLDIADVPAAFWLSHARNG
jgi:hypothetical protein